MQGQVAFPCWCYVRLFWNDLCWTERIVNVSVSAFPAPNAVHVPCPTCPTCNQKSSLLATRDSLCVGLACRLSNHALVQDSVLPRTCSGLCAAHLLPELCAAAHLLPLPGPVLLFGVRYYPPRVRYYPPNSSLSKELACRCTRQRAGWSSSE